jgi:hypothetical protein
MLIAKMGQVWKLSTMSKPRKWIFSRCQIRSRAIVLLLIPIAGCTTSATPAPPSDRFIRTGQIDGCWQHTVPREYNIAIGSGLEQYLRAQLAGRVLELPQCWYEDQSGQILLVAGEECAAYDEFTFQNVDGTWKLANAVRRELVMCHEKMRK